MSSVIRIKRSSGILAPSSLKTAELAYAYGTGTQGNKGDRLFIGTGDNGAGAATAITIIGGSYFTDMLDHVSGTLTASSAIVVDSDKKIDQLLSGNIVIDGATNKISGLVDPTDSSGAATKRYVDNLNQLQGILFTGDSGSDSVNLADSGLNFQGQAGEIHTKITNNNLLISLDSSGVVAGTYGSTTAVPIITVDDFGRIDSVGTAPASVIFNVTADSGTGDSVNLLDSALNFSGSTGIITKVTDNNIDIRLDSTGISHSSANFHTDGNRKYGTGSGLEIAVDDFGRISHVVNTTINAELRVRDDPSNPFKSLFLGGQNDLIIKEGPGVKVTLTGPTHSGGGADYTPGTFEIAVDSGGTVTANIVQADSGTYGSLVVGGDSNRGWAHGLPNYADASAPENHTRQPATFQQAGNAVFGLAKDNAQTFSIVQFFDSEGGNFFMGPEHSSQGTSVSNPIYGVNPARVVGHWQAVNPNYNLGNIEKPWRGTALDKNLDFTAVSGSYMSFRENNDSAFSIRSRNNSQSFPTFTTMVNYNTLDSQIEYHVDQRLKIDKYIYFGDSPSHGYIGKESTDQWLNIGNGGTGIALYSNNIKLSSTANNPYKIIEVQGSIKPVYTPGVLFDIGDSLGLVPATNYRSFKDGYFSGTLFADSFQRTGISIDSGTYGSATTIPVFTVNQAGMIDSVGSVASSGIDSASWHPATNTLKITTDAETVHSVQIDDFDTDISIAVDKYINFGTGGKIRKESVDQHLQIINNGTVTVTGTSVDLISTSNDPFKSINARGHIKPVYFPAAGGFDIGESADWTWRNAFFSGNVTSRTDAVDSNHVVLKRQLDSDITSVTLDSASWDKDNHNLNLTIGGNVTQVTINEFDNIKIDGNTISSTDSSNRLFIDPFPVGDSGDLVIRGNLIVEGTETIVNSSVVSLNDKNLVLADSAANSGIADGAGITIGGAQYTGTKPQFVFDAATDRWDPNLPFDIPFASLDSAIFFNGVALREVVEDHLDNFFGVDSNNALSLTYNDVANSMTWKAINATKSQVGVSSFDSSNFSVTAGHVAVTVLDGGTY